MRGKMARVLRGFIRSGLNVTSSSKGLKPKELLISEGRFIRSGAPSPPDQRQMEIEAYQPPEREVVMEPGAYLPFQILQNIDEVILSR